MKKNLHKKLLNGIFMFAMLLTVSNSWGQLTLPATGTSYTQNFNTLSSGLPEGWTVRTGATANAIGTSVTSLSQNTWSATNGAFNNFASANGGSLSNSAQGTATDRALGVRQTGSLGDPGAAFVLQLTNTTGKTSFNLSLKHQILDVQARSTIWTVQYSTAATGNAWTTVGTTFTDPGAFGSTSRTYSFATALDNKSTTIYIRVVALTSSSGSGSRDSYGIDDFVLSWANAPATPIVATTQVTAASITTSTATSGGNVTSNGGSTVTTRGVVYGTTANPDLDDEVIATGSGTGTFVSSLTGLFANTQYFYRAYAINTTGTAYGTEYNFYTKANTPAALVVSNPTLNSLDIAINTTDSNPETTQYAIAVSGGVLGNNTYINALGQTTATAVFRTAEQWAATATLTGLDQATTYTFKVKARNNAATPVETDFGPEATGTTLTPTTPFLTLEEVNLNYDTICISNASTGSFTISGGNLTNHTIHISALNGYSYSFTEDSETYSDDEDIINYNGEEITVYVRFSPTAVQSYDGVILLTGTDVPNLEVNTIGTGIDTPGTATTRAATVITSVSAALNGTAVAGGCTAITGYGVEYSTVNNFTPGTGIQVNSAVLEALPDFSLSVNGLSPQTTYYFRSFITDGSTVNGGTHYGSQLSFTTTGLTAPVAAFATVITQTGFTANWAAVAGAQGYRLDVSEHEIFGTATYASDLIISEYVESRTGNNKAIEIYNGTGATVNLSAYALKQQANGSGAFGASADYDLPLPNFNLAHGEAYVVASDGATAISNKDLEINYNAPQGGKVVHFTGNDPIGLYKNNVQIDLITGGTDVTLVRNATVNAPTTNYNANQWTTYADGTYTYIGSHTMNTNFVASLVAGYNNLDVNNVTSYAVTGLAPFKRYYYRVRAYSANSTSVNSNVISLNTKPTQVTWEIASGSATAAWAPARYADNTPVSVDETIDAVVAANYNTGLNGTFTAKSVTLNSGKTFTVTTGTTLNVKGAIVNNAGAANFVVENNAALLQGTDVTNTANITVVKNSNELFRLDYTLWASPVSGLSLGDFSSRTSTGRFYEYKYDLDTTLGTSVEQYFIVPPTTLFEEAKGYLIRMPNGNLDVAGYNAGTAAYSFKGIFTGTPNNGPVSKPASTQGYRYTAVGNPYPSPISVAAFFSANSGVLNETSGLYFWRKRNGAATSSYATLTLAGYAASQEDEGYVPVEGNDPGGQGAFYNGAESSWLISQGQGFIVKTSATPTVTEITFNNSMRRPAPANGNQAFFRTAASTRSRLWLNLKDSQQNFSQATIAYMDNATTGIDYGYDGAMLNDGGRVALFSLAANTTLAIQARPAFTATDVVPMGFNAIAAGQFTLSISHADGLFEQGQDVFIKDNLLGTVTRLDTPYTFTSEAGTFNQRFEVVYTADILDTDAPVLNANSVIVYKEGNAINITTGTVQITGVTVYDINGRKLYTKTGIEAATTSIDDLQAASQVLIIEVNTVKGKVSKRIVF